MSGPEGRALRAHCPLGPVGRPPLSSPPHPAAPHVPAGAGAATPAGPAEQQRCCQRVVSECGGAAAHREPPPGIQRRTFFTGWGGLCLSRRRVGELFKWEELHISDRVRTGQDLYGWSVLLTHFITLSFKSHCLKELNVVSRLCHAAQIQFSSCALSVPIVSNANAKRLRMLKSVLKQCYDGG